MWVVGPFESSPLLARIALVLSRCFALDAAGEHGWHEAYSAGSTPPHSPLSKMRAED